MSWNLKTGCRKGACGACFLIFFSILNGFLKKCIEFFACTCTNASSRLSLFLRIEGHNRFKNKTKSIKIKKVQKAGPARPNAAPSFYIPRHCGRQRFRTPERRPFVRVLLPAGFPRSSLFFVVLGLSFLSFPTAY